MSDIGGDEKICLHSLYCSRDRTDALNSRMMESFLSVNQYFVVPFVKRMSYCSPSNKQTCCVNIVFGMDMICSYITG
jgi:hypothetical protein